MATRSKLAAERLALMMLDMQLRYGPVVREKLVKLTYEGVCVACAQSIEVGEAHVARWQDRIATSGFYAHVKCPPLDSDWLTDDGFYQVWDYYVPGAQNCAACGAYHRASVRVVVPVPPEKLSTFPRGGVLLSYVCDECVNRPARSRE